MLDIAHEKRAGAARLFLERSGIQNVACKSGSSPE